VNAIVRDTRDYIITSHSIDGTFESCPRRFEFRHVYEQRPLMESSGMAADVGTALHEAVQEWTKDRSLENAYITLLKWWPWDLEAKRIDAGLTDSKRTLGNALLLLDAICAHHFWDDWEVARLPDGAYAIELPWRINHISLGSFPHPVSGKPVFLATQGKIDWILRHKRDRNRYMVTDLKTTVLNETAQQASFRFSGQAGQYGLILASAINHPWQREGMDVTYFVAEFSEHGLPEINPLTYHLDPDEIFESIEAKNERLRRMVSMGHDSFWPRRSHGCAFYGTPCGFLDVCHRRDPAFLSQWFAAERQSFQTEKRIYSPFWTIDA
jgi:hypothetical protein